MRRFLNHTFLPLCFAMTAAFVAGCSGGDSQTPATAAPLTPQANSVPAVRSEAMLTGAHINALPPGMRIAGIASTRRPAFVNVAAVNAPGGNQTIIADAASATVTVWGAAGQLNAILFDGILANPEGLTTDDAESLYVANTGLSNVIVYPKPYRSHKRTLNDAGEEPIDVAVSSTGLVAVTNYLTTALQPGSTSLYSAGSTTACVTLQDSKWITFIDDAFDASGNLFIDGQDSAGNTLVGEISGGCTATAIRTLSVKNTISSPGSIAVSRGTILIGDPLNLSIYTYAPPVNGALGSPTKTTLLAGADHPISFAITNDGGHVWTADENASAAFAGKYTYPGGSFLTSLNDHLLPIGVAVNPAAVP